jgi:uncharacterized protein YtpQ (UPF0354 family)
VKPIELKRLLEDRLSKEGRTFHYDRDQEQLRIEEQVSNKGITLSLSGLASKYETQGQSIIDEIVHYAEEGLKGMSGEIVLTDKEKNIFPVIRSGSFPTEQNGNKLVFEEHTGETRIYYALDLGKSYRLLSEEILQREGWEVEQIKQIAQFNLRSLKIDWKIDQVAGNTFYFVNHNDGYDASRILNHQFLAKTNELIEGTFALAVPHQDVLILADIKNDKGYDVLSQMAMHFFTNGNVPITGLPFLYEAGKLEPIFVYSQEKPRKDEKGDQ